MAFEENRELATDDRLWALLQDAVKKCEDLMTALEHGDGGQEQMSSHTMGRIKNRPSTLLSALNPDA